MAGYTRMAAKPNEVGGEALQKNTESGSRGKPVAIRLSVESSASLGIPRALDSKRGVQHRLLDAGRG